MKDTGPVSPALLAAMAGHGRAEGSDRSVRR